MVTKNTLYVSSLVFAICCHVNTMIIEDYALRGGDFNPLPLKLQRSTELTPKSRDLLPPEPTKS